MSTAPKYQPHYTIDDYTQWDGDWELWNGIPVSMSPAPNPRHQQIATQLVTALSNSISQTDPTCSKCIALVEVDWKVSRDTVVRPDVLVTCDPLPEKHIESPPVFVAEVLSPSTARKDQTVKRELYQSQGVQYYLILDPTTKTSQLLELDSSGLYQSMPPTQQSNSKSTLRFSQDCEIELELFAW